MLIKRTVVFPINLTPKQKKALLETMKLYMFSWRRCVDEAWKLDKPTKFDIHHITYYLLQSELGLKSQYLCSSKDQAVESVCSAKALLKKGKKTSKPTAKQIPMRLESRTMSFDKTMEVASIATQRGRIKVPIVWHKQAQKYRDWDYQAGEIGLDKKGQWVLRVVFKKEITMPSKTNRVVAGDRGIKNPLVTSDNRFIGERICNEQIRKFYGLIARLQSKGTKSAKRHLKKCSGRMRRFQKDCNRKMARELLLSMQPGDIVVLEYLTGIKDRCGIKGKANKKHRRKMGQWNTRGLVTEVENLAPLIGIYVEYVSPKYTSQTCSQCGVICKSNRKNQATYLCTCGLNLHADLNAARNIENKWRKANGFALGPTVNRPIVTDL